MGFMILKDNSEGRAWEGSIPTLTETPPVLINLKISDSRLELATGAGENELNPEDVVAIGVLTGVRESRREDEIEERSG